MSTAETREANLLEAVLAGYRARGFDVYVRPPSRILPEFILPYQLDAVAIKADEKIAIEVTRSRATSADRIQRLQAAFAAHPDWTLNVYYSGELNTEDDIAVSPLRSIEGAIEEVDELRKSGRLRAALVMGWAIVESIARSLLPDQLGRQQPPNTLVETLASNGFLTPGEADSLRSMISVRNAAAHGHLDVIVEPKQLDQLVDTLRTLFALLGKDSSG
jgi:uncharacterized protein YutE (UPF0331/DUF86 family)